MGQFKIMCTPELIRKAFNLGMKIDQSIEAEQLIFWIEHQANIEEVQFIHLREKGKILWNFYVTDRSGYIIIDSNDLYHSRREVYLTAIDAALDYLLNKEPLEIEFL